MIRIGKSVSDLSVSFYIMEHNKLAIADLTKMDYLEDFFKEDGNWYYFNRLNIPNGFRIQNASILLMQEISKWADENQINIFDEINPYGKLNLEQIIVFNKLFGFKMYQQPNAMVRYHRGHF
jgi:hypothetical protein